MGYTCPACGGRKEGFYAKSCRSCHLDSKGHKRICPDCGGKKAYYAQACSTCTTVRERGSDSYNCRECGGQKAALRAKLCRSCDTRRRARSLEELMRSIWSRIDQHTTPNGCWLWTGSTSPDGYGAVQARALSKQPIKVTRLVLEEVLGRKLQAGELALHTCDNPPCCRPNHLFAGTYSDNVQDMIAKGRASWQQVSV